MRWLWTWDGVCFGYQEGNDLWTYDGQHVGRFDGDKVFDCNGRYLGEIESNRLTKNSGHIALRNVPFRPQQMRGHHPRPAPQRALPKRTDLCDFPLPEEFIE